MSEQFCFGQYCKWDIPCSGENKERLLFGGLSVEQCDAHYLQHLVIMAISYAGQIKFEEVPNFMEIYEKAKEADFESIMKCIRSGKMKPDVLERFGISVANKDPNKYKNII